MDEISMRPVEFPQLKYRQIFVYTVVTVIDTKHSVTMLPSVE